MSGADGPSPLARLDDSDIERYSRQLLLDELGEAEQLRVMHSRAVVIGCGGLGGPAALHLVGAGVGSMRLVDPDLISLDNLHRQVAFRASDVGRPKAEVLGSALMELNPRVAAEALVEPLPPASLDLTLRDCDLVLECSDQPSLKFAVNDWCVRHRVPLVVGGAIGWRGQVTSVVPDSGCFRCLFRAPTPGADLTCRLAGVIGPLVGVIGALQALEGVRLLIGPGAREGRLSDFDARTGRWRVMALRRDPACAVHPAAGAAQP